VLTLFTTPKPFRDHTKAIQQNAIRSWTLLRPPCEIILFGDEEGTAEVAAEMGLRHVPDIARNEFGTPLVGDLFEKAQALATSDLLCYVNADIILRSGFMEAVGRAARWKRRFVMVGQRWDVDLRTRWDFTGEDWEEQLREFVSRFGRLHPPAGSDYFVFPRGTLGPLPPFVVGRPGWDNWVISYARKSGIPVVDATRVVTVIHQNHGYGHIRDGRGDSWEGVEAEKNRRLSGSEYPCTLLDSTHLLTTRGVWPAITPAHVARRAKVLAWQIPGTRLVMRGIRSVGRGIVSTVHWLGEGPGSEKDQ
jgi:hypothetical protein